MWSENLLVIFEGQPSAGHLPRGPTKVAEERPRPLAPISGSGGPIIGSPLATIVVNSILGNGGFPIPDMKVPLGSNGGLGSW